MEEKLEYEEIFQPGSAFSDLQRLIFPDPDMSSVAIWNFCEAGE